MSEKHFTIRVACYAGYRGEEPPQRFFFQDRPIEVTRVLDRWLAPDHRYFKIVGDDDAIYIIRHDIATSEWELTLYERNRNDNNQ